MWSTARRSRPASACRMAAPSRPRLPSPATARASSCPEPAGRAAALLLRGERELERRRVEALRALARAGVAVERGRVDAGEGALHEGADADREHGERER